MWEFHHVRAFPRKVHVANSTWFSIAQLLIWNIDSIFSNHYDSTTTPSVPLKVRGLQFRKSLYVHSRGVRTVPLILVSKLWLPSPWPLVLFQRVSWLASTADTLALISCSTTAAPEVLESILMPLTTVHVVMKPVQSMLSSVTPMRRYGNPASSKLGHSSIDPLKGRRCYLLNSLCRVYPNIPNAIAGLIGSLTSDLGTHSADKPIIRSMTSSRSRS
ncbi:hypothetical protein Tco_0050624, partial [Tanacetum coccineum]